MRIGFDAKRAFLNNTGLGNYSRDSIRVLSQYFPENNYFLFTPKRTEYEKIVTNSTTQNIIIKTPDSLISKALKDYWRSNGIIKDLIKNKIELFHGLSNELPVFLEKTSIKKIVTIHDLIFIRYPNLFTFIDRKIYYQKFKSACEKADKIIAVSKQTKKDIINFFCIPEEKISVVYQGCNKAFQIQINQNQKQFTLKKYNLPKKYLLYVGTIEERKNLITLLKTLKELPNQNLVIIGNGKSYKKKCLKFVSDNKLEKQIFFLKDLSLDEMATIYQSADIMIYPSIFEGFGIPILEALFSKTPVISSNGGCFIEAGGPNSKYINPLSFTEIKRAILEIQNSASLRENMIKKGFEYAQEFTDEKIANNLMQVYTNL